MNAPKQTSLVIAIDGPAASGKGTLARRVAAHYGLPHLDTGLIYRAVGAHMLQHELDLDSEEQAVGACADIDFTTLNARRDELTDPGVGEAASRVAAKPEVRAKLVQVQRDFGRNGAVVDGRDIGTVIFPDAPVKLYIDADIAVRANRRFLEQRSKGFDVDEATVLDDIRRRDERDMNREVAPLKPADDARLLDTSDCDIEAATALALNAVESRLKEQGLAL